MPGTIPTAKNIAANKTDKHALHNNKRHYEQGKVKEIPVVGSWDEELQF